MKLWMSGEIQLDVSDTYREARRNVESNVNELLGEVSFESNIRQWAFIAIILPDESPDYPEVARFHKRDRSLEFRLRLDHGRFKAAAPTERGALLLDGLARSILKMPSLGVAESDCAKLTEILRVVRGSHFQ